MPPTALQLRDIGFAYEGKPPLLRHVTLHVPPRAITVVMGANGSGKTTLLRIAAGLVAPQQGDAMTSDGVTARDAMRSGRVGYIPQQLGLIRSGSVMENVLMGGLRASGALSVLGLHKAAVRDRAEAALDLVGLREKSAQPTRTLSGGERQRVAIARTLVQQPDVLVADELIASLDAVHAHAIMEVTRGLSKQGIAVLMALHHIDVALANADQLVFLVRGGLTNPRRPDGMTPEEARSALTAGSGAAPPAGVWGQSPQGGARGGPR